MAGVALTTLEGWAIPVASSVFDHTYAVSGCGLRWRCWGRSAGGAAICAGPGSSIIADCLSQLNSRAGIVYGVTGTCQQTANRILHPANIVVAAAGGYPVSVFTFGVYGRGVWHQRNTCHAGSGGGPPNLASGGGPADNESHNKGREGPSGDQQAIYYRAVLMAHQSQSDEDAVRLAELAALIELRLGKPLDRQTFEVFALIQLSLRKKQEELAGHLMSRKITEREYLVHFNSALQDAMLQSEKLLGSHRFQSVFGKAGYQPEKLVDAEIFLGRGLK